MIKKIRSGGQTGADRAALDAARKLNIPITGWVPKGGWAEDDAHLLELYPELLETSSFDPALRTRLNVRNSDATLIFLPEDCVSPGTDLAIAFSKELEKPYFVASLETPSLVISSWLSALGDIELNIAGPRESEYPGIYNLVFSILSNLLAE